MKSRPILTVFPKFLTSLSATDLARTVADCGLPAVNLVVRRGTWVERETMAAQGPAFCRTMRDAGLEVSFCTLGESPAALTADPTPLEILADCGVTTFRLAYFQHQEGKPLRAQVEAARASLASLVPLLDRHGLRAIYQVHHGISQLLCTASVASMLVEGLPEARIGIMPDAGNQGFEGYEGWGWTQRVLGAHWTAMGVKDVAPAQDEGGRWTRKDWAPCQEGAADWTALAAAYRDAGGDAGHWVMHPFYYHDDLERHVATLKQEVAYVSRVLDQAFAAPDESSTPST